jgi:hypothetical protein
MRRTMANEWDVDLPVYRTNSLSSPSCKLSDPSLSLHLLGKSISVLLKLLSPAGNTSGPRSRRAENV